MSSRTNNTTQRILTGLIISVMPLLTCCGDDEGDDQDNHNCEAACTVEYLEDMPACDEGSMSCLLGCESLEDDKCMNGCQTCWSGLDDDLTSCESYCPCMSEWTDCEAACTDHECLDWCETNFHTCIGPDSLYLIITSCIADKYNCESNCEESSLDVQEYLDCRINCKSTFNDCLLQLDE